MRVQKITTRSFKVVLLIALLAQVVLGVHGWFDDSQHKTNRFVRGFDAHDVVLTKRSIAADRTVIDFSLEGAEFELYRVDAVDEKIGTTYTTDANGEIWMHNLEVGDYYFLEVNPPLGHSFDLDKTGNPIRKYTFKVDTLEQPDGQPIHVDAYNIQNDVALEIMKTIVNSNGEDVSVEQQAELFSFKVTFNEKIDDDEAIDTKDYVYSIDGGPNQTIKNGEIIQLKHGQKAIFKYLPYGTRYDVKELSDHDYTMYSSFATGFVYDRPLASFVNQSQSESLGIVALTKYIRNQSGEALTDAQKEKQFEFEITFSDGGTYPVGIGNKPLEMVSSGGTIQLRHNETAYIFKLPFGTTYTIKEKDYSSEGYLSQLGVIEGQIIVQDMMIYNINNIYQDAPEIESGSLLIAKRVVYTTLRDTFQFKVDFQPAGNFKYRIDDGDLLEYKSGDSIEITADQTILFEDLPIGTVYKVTESEHDDYFASVLSQSGTVSDYNQTVVFRNYFKNPDKDLVSITVTKKVSGVTTDKSFEFIMNFDDSKEVFTLKDGESKEFQMSPGTVYAVEERDYSKDGYELVITNSHGTVETKKNVEVIATNIFHKELAKAQIKGIKSWSVAPGYENRIPSAITVNLLNENNEVVASTIVKEDAHGKWEYAFEVARFDENGVEIVYHIEEEPIDDFIATYDGFNILNTFTVPTSYLPKVTKQLIGEEHTHVPAQFVFTITALEGAPIVNSGSIAIDGSGEASFAALEFKHAGTFKYRIEEKVQRLKDYTFDRKPITLTITTINQDDAIVIASVSYDKEGFETNATTGLFINTYTGAIKPPVDPEEPLDPPTYPGDLPATGLAATGFMLQGGILTMVGTNLIIYSRITTIRRNKNKKEGDDGDGSNS
ncbi:Cna B-type domain-containing protein [Erysipelothrix sp. HDW6C]|uniref:DUF7601 domain-containing protein n=1 Tax=Erysipelothrix sp. HDW6C TaxID=2714930 RepID=UPI0014074060|nr:DUF5979 domain-containing protein [Erysipelothrix sp. HDW6C]QIK69367.1 Cna B-type domain-containing protein [Erysipelothrix sp. HDW6C]